MKKSFSKLFAFSLALSLPFIAEAQNSNSSSLPKNFDFDSCMNKASKINEDASADCMKYESERLEQLIYAEYENILNDENFKTWNENGTMFRGKLRTLYENWKAYRESFCSLYAFSMDGYLGSNHYNTQRCKLDLTRKHYDYIKVIRSNKISTPD